MLLFKTLKIMKEIFTTVLERCFLNCYYMNPSVIINKLKEMTFEKYDVYELDHTNEKAVICIGEDLFQIWFYLSPKKVITSIEIY